MCLWNHENQLKPTMNQGQIIETQENYERPGATHQKQGITNKKNKINHKNQRKPWKEKTKLEKNLENWPKTVWNYENQS